MNELLKFKLKSEIKKELIEYYDSLQKNVNLKTKNLLNNKSLKQIERKEYLERNVFLVEQIDRICNSNLNDINQHFGDNLKNNQNEDGDDPSLNKKRKNDESEVQLDGSQDFDEISMKEDIKKKALKSYLIYFEKDPKYIGMHFEFDWYIDKYQLELIK